MRACVQTEIGRVEVREVPDPEPGEGEVVIAVRAALTCGTDAKLFRRGHPEVALPTVAGHEFSGDVVATGRDVANWRVGDAVMVGLSGPCRDCSRCRRGFSNLCGSSGGRLLWGAFAEKIRVPRRIVEGNLHRKPDSLDYAEAAALDPLAAVVHGFFRLGGECEGTLVVLGLGALGLLWVASARFFGARRIIALGKGERRLAVARALGAETVDVTWDNARERIRSLVKAGGAETVVECVGTPATWEEAVAYAAPGGRVLFFGGCAAGTRASLETAPIHYSELSLMGAFHYRPEDAARAAELLANRKVDLNPLLTGEAGLGDVGGLLASWGSGEAIKTVVRP